MDTDEAYEHELRAERDQLLTAYEAIDSGAALLDFQLQLATAIEAREEAAFKLKDAAAKEHLRLLRLLGDGLAWQLLHSYAIRQLAKNAAPPPALSNQGDGFRLTLDAARKVAEAGHLVLISDLTHCLTIGDLIVCDDPEHPSIVECGGHEKFLHKGRKARQFQRAEAVIDLLKDGTAAFPGDERATRMLELKTGSIKSWAVVDRVVLAADREGSAAECVSNGDLVFAVRDEDADPLNGLTDHMAQPTFAIYTRLLERPDPRVPPCVAWDVSLDAKRLLYQGDVFVGHVVDVVAFIGRRSGNAEIVKVLHSGNEVTGFGVLAGDNPLSFSHEFLTDVLLGFATIESTADAILEAAQRTLDMGEERVRTEGPGNAEEYDRLVQLVDEHGFISPVDAWRELNRER